MLRLRFHASRCGTQFLERLTQKIAQSTHIRGYGIRDQPEAQLSAIARDRAVDAQFVTRGHLRIPDEESRTAPTTVYPHFTATSLQRARQPDCENPLIHHPEFAGLVNDIVVEAGNSLYQAVMDKFVAGEKVPCDALRRVWQDTTQPHDVWDKPIYEEFYRAVRALNSGLAGERRLRVLLGDPAVDWAAVHTRSDFSGRSDDFPTELIRREPLAKGRRALIIYGGMHLQRHDYGLNYEPGHGIVGVLERDAPGSVFSIWTNTLTDLQAAQPSVSSWPNPSLAMLRGTLLGAQDFAVYYPFPVYKFDKSGKITAQKPARPLRMEEQFDAVLYLFESVSGALPRSTLR